MFTVLTSNLIIPPKEEETILQAYDRVYGTLHNQADLFIQQWEPDVLPAAMADKEWRSIEKSAALSWDEWHPENQPGVKFARLQLRYKYDQHSWEANCKLGIDSTSRSVGVGLSWSRSTTSGSTYPLQGPPRLLRAIAEEAGNSSDLDIPFGIHHLPTEDVHGFHFSVICNPNRYLPVLLISPLSDGSLPRVNGKFLAEWMSGLALVYEFIDNAAATIFKGLASAACYDGAIRLYWPLSDQTQTNPYWSKNKLALLEPRYIRQLLFQRVAQGSMRYIAHLDTLSLLERARATTEQQHKHELTQESNDYATQVDALERTVLQLEVTVSQDKEERDDLIDQLDELKKKNDRLEGLTNYQEDKLRDLELKIAQIDTAPIQEQHRRILLSHKADAIYTDAEPAERRNIDQILHKLSRLVKGERRQFAMMDKKRSSCWTHPKGPSRGAMRIFGYDHEDGSIQICEISKHDSSYDKHHQEGVRQEDYPPDRFVLWDPLPEEQKLAV